MQANKTYTFMVTCKCPGHLGAARIEVNYTANRDGSDFFMHMWNNRYYEVACWSCRRYFKIQGLQAKYSEKHQCSAKCLASKGPSCECSCRGANHGRSYAIA